MCVQSFMAVSDNNALWQHRTDQTEECVYRALWLYLTTMLYGNIGLTKLRNVCIELYSCICKQCLLQHRTDQTEEFVYRALWLYLSTMLYDNIGLTKLRSVYRALWLYLSTMLYGNIGLTKLRNVCTELYGCICQQCFMAI